MPSCASWPRRPACAERCSARSERWSARPRAAARTSSATSSCTSSHRTQPIAGDDAADAAWFTPDELDALATSPGLVEALAGWGLLARGIPVIDLSVLRGPDPAAETARLRSALHETGFLYVTGHGVPASVVEGVFAAAREFFALPIEDRLAIDEVNSPHFRGYTQLGNELTQGRADQRDQLDVGPEREPLVLGPGDPAYLRMTGPNQWPAALPTLRPAVLAWYDEARRVSIELLQCIAVALGQPAEWFDPWFDEQTHDHLKVIRYPGSLVRDGDQGVGAHKDYGWLALLVQDDLGGLQVQALDGTWLDATPVPGTFVVNIGEMLEVATRGYLRATVHRVVSPPTTQDRYSIPFFLGPRLDATVPAIPLPDDLAAQARGIEDDPDNPLLSVYGANALKGWLRAHPRVAERWWADVVDGQRQLTGNSAHTSRRSPSRCQPTSVRQRLHHRQAPAVTGVGTRVEDHRARWSRRDCSR